MYYKRGKGAKVYRSSGFKSYGCLISLLIFPIQILSIAISTIINSIIDESKNN